MVGLTKLTLCLFIISLPVIVRCDEQNAVAIKNASEIICGNIGEMLVHCFSTLSPSMLEILSTAHSVTTIKDIQNRCVVFNHGLDCAKRYERKCLNSQMIVENSVFGAKKLFAYLCKDEYFQQEFLQHNSCYNHIEQDWDKCARAFNHLLQDELTNEDIRSNINTKYLNICCSRYAFEACVFTSARLKCRLESAVFMRKMARLLSTEKQFSNCDKIEEQLCSSASRISKRFTELNVCIVYIVFVLYVVIV